MSEINEIKVPDKVLPKLQQLLSQKNLAEMQFNIYVQGCFDALGLDGNWDLNTNTWTFVRLTKPESQPEGGVK